MIYTAWYWMFIYGVGCCLAGAVWGYLVKSWIK